MDDKNKIEDNNYQEENLTRIQRKKLKRQQFKEEKKIQREAQSRQKLYKKIGLISFGIIILAVIGYFIYSNSKFIMPTADDDPIIGNVNAPLTIIEFGDFKCPFTKQFNTRIMKDLFERYGEEIKIVYRDMPTGKHGDATLPAMAAQCANEQGKFKEYHDSLFQNQQLSSKIDYKNLALNLGLDTSKFNECLDSGRYKSEVKKDYRDGKKARVMMTPTLFINGVMIQGIVDENIYMNIINEQLSKLKY